MRRLMALLFVVTAFSQMALGEDIVKISGASPATFELVTSHKEELKSKLGITVQTLAARAPLAIKNVILGNVDGYTGPDPAPVVKTLVDDHEIPPGDADKLMNVELGRSFTFATVHPDNPVKTLTHEQIKGILSGAIQSWEPITGQKEELVLVMATDFVSTPKLLSKAYGIEQVKAKELVKDLVGQVRALKARPKNVITFSVKVAEPIEGIQPRQIATEGSQPLSLYVRKDAKAPALKLFEFMKSKQSAAAK